MDVLRLAGAPGVGKSATGWALAQRLAAAGDAAGYVDIDQLGMCYPAPVGDPDRWYLKERVLTGVIEEFARAGAARLVVSGVALPTDPPPQADEHAVCGIWLDASEQTRRLRLAERRLAADQLAQTLEVGSAEAAQVVIGWERIVTDQHSQEETALAVLQAWRSATAESTQAGPPAPAAPATAQPPAAPATAQPPPGGASESPSTPAISADPVLWLTGPRLSGASRLGWELASRDWSAGRRIAFADLAQLSFGWNLAAPVGLANLAALHRTVREAGAVALVVVAPLEVDPAAVRAALPGSDVAFVRLSVSATDRRHHADSRRHDRGPLLAGEDLRGAADAVVDRVLRDGAAQEMVPLRPQEVCVDVSGLSLPDAVTRLRHTVAW